MLSNPNDDFDCLLVGAGPAGLTAALYLARFNRRFLLIDDGNSRAAWIPTSHNIPHFADGISGRDILALHRKHLARYGHSVESGRVAKLEKSSSFFSAEIESEKGDVREVRAKRVLLATGAIDVEPDLPDLPNAVQKGLIRYCPICDGYETAGKKIAVIGYGTRGLAEAIFVARTYSRDVTLLTMGQGAEFDDQARQRAEHHSITIMREPIAALRIDNDRIAALRSHSGTEHSYDVLYSALGLKLRSELATALGAAHDGTGALEVDEHNRTSIWGLYAAGGVVRSLDQVVVAMGHAAIAATDIHNRCEMPTEEETDGGVAPTAR